MATVNQVTERTPEQMQQKQLLAKQLGLDLNLYQQFSQNPNAFKQQYGQFFDSATNTFKIPNIIPGGLIGAPQGPNGTVLAAGSTPTNPLDLGAVTRSTVTPTGTFLPPYLGGGNQTAPPPTPNPVVTPPQPGTPMKLNRPNAGLRGPVAFPQYLRKRPTIAYG